MNYQPSDLVRRAWQQPPGCIAAFAIEPLERPVGVGEVHDELAVFRLACRCGSRHWRVLGYPHPEAEFACPYFLECVACGVSELLFDVGKHGYDAQIDEQCYSIRGSGAPSAIRCESCAGSRFQALPSFSYQIEPIEDLGKEAVASIEDYFDCFGLHVICERCEHQQCAGDYECACSTDHRPNPSGL